MSKVWVRAKTIIHVEEKGSTYQAHPGDWVRMGRHQARQLLANDQVEILKAAVLKSVQDLTDCAILLAHEMPEERLSFLTAKFPGVPVQMYSGGYPQHGRFLLWDTRAELQHELILTGFKLLETWQAAIPLMGYEVLAESIGTDQEREETQAIIHDLRVPIYDTRVIFARRCMETKQLFELWQNGSQLQFLQAVYQSRPIINALPPSWILKA